MRNVLLASVAFVFVAATTSFAATPVENQAMPTAKPIYNGLQMLADNDGDGGAGNDSGGDNDSGDDNDGGGNDDGADHDSNDDHGGAAAGNDDHDAEDANDDDGATKRVKKQKSLMSKKIKSKS